MSLVVPSIPNYKLLEEGQWNAISYDIRNPKDIDTWVKDIKKMAIALGEINRYHSKALPDKKFYTLQKRMTEIERIVGAINKDRMMKGKNDLIPKNMLKYWYGGCENKKLLRGM